MGSSREKPRSAKENLQGVDLAALTKSAPGRVEPANSPTGHRRCLALANSAGSSTKCPGAGDTAFVSVVTPEHAYNFGSVISRKDEWQQRPTRRMAGQVL
jgi:hypothetical protein